jgi:hypothetical protein
MADNNIIINKISNNYRYDGLTAGFSKKNLSNNNMSKKKCDDRSLDNSSHLNHTSNATQIVVIDEALEEFASSASIGDLNPSSIDTRQDKDNVVDLII